MPRYSKWIDYEFASDIEHNGMFCTGYLIDIIENIIDGKSMHNFLYVVEIRLEGRNVINTIQYTCKEFQKHFYNRTVLPK
jgi:hypothetical protein